MRASICWLWEEGGVRGVAEQRDTHTGFFSSAAARHAMSASVRGAQGGSAGMLLPHLQVLQLLPQRMRLNVRAQLQSLLALCEFSEQLSAERKRPRICVKMHLHC